MKSIYITIPDEVLQHLIDKYHDASPVDEPDYFSVYLSLEELKRFRSASAEPEPKALTVEELREMDGQPVWIKSQKYEGWALVNLSRHEIGFLVDPNGQTYGIGGADALFDAYDRQPKGAVT